MVDAAGAMCIPSGGDEPKMSSRELSTSGTCWSVWVEVIVVAGEAGADGELESWSREFGIAVGRGVDFGRISYLQAGK